MTIQQWNRREELREALSDLVMQIAQLGCAPGTLDTPLFQQLEQEMKEKTAELEALNALYNDPAQRRELDRYGMVQENREILCLLCGALVFASLIQLFFVIVDCYGGSPSSFQIVAFAATFLMGVFFFYLLHKYGSE